MINFIGAVVIGVVIGLVGWLVLRRRQPVAIWLPPVLAVAGALVASVLALIFGDRADYGWKELTLQVVLAVAGVAAAYLIGSRSAAPTGASAE